MFGNIENDFLSVGTYARAVHSFEHTRPIRGLDKVYHGVPLRTSRRDHSIYRLTRFVEGGPVVAWMYQTPILTVHPDDKLEVCAYDSHTTRKVLTYLLPYGFHLSAQRSLQVLYVKQEPHYIAGTFIIDQQAKQVHNLQRVQVKRINRKLARAALQPYAEHIKQYSIWNSLFTSTRTANEFLAQYDTTPMAVDWGICSGRGLDLEDPHTWVLMAASDIARPLNLLEKARQLIYSSNDVHYNEILPEGTMHKDARPADVLYSVSY